MTLEQLKIFLAVAEHLHFTRAAETLYVTQPAVSAAIQSLESEFGVKLFHRIGRRIEITDAGKLLKQEAQKIMAQVAQTERELRELNNLQRGELRIGSSFTVGNYWLPDKISLFQRQYPHIKINCSLANADEICAGTSMGLFDIGIVAGEVKAALESALCQEVVGSDRLLIVVGQSHPWFHDNKIPVEDLLKTQWVMREAGSGTQQMFEQALQQWGISLAQLKVLLVLNSSEMIKEVIESGEGAAAVPELMVKKELLLETLRVIEVFEPETNTCLDIVRPVYKLKHPQRFQTRVLEAFEEVLELFHD
ncbi:LysR substrate-binding domain-containing protein [Gloeothece verrucosa]|uniref:Transcriptional regulator, LysR family n=1 Tax=Gloeothece verrucosa (strain PCC 7822) TaxID=497965 RepID=E0U6C6_GLOV7|nr:LysR substrate-binding domain-containing protein [Gloeothece verrucosa]ADN13569.1 transcriptional regulator, LysR family [Gloeothece verrucosa PCC 7822]